MVMFNRKKGSASEIMWPEITYLILFLVFAAILLIFAKNAAGGVSATEEIYAKKIALIIDGARPITTIMLDVTDAYNMALKEKKTAERVIKESFILDKQKHCVMVSLGTTTGGYSYCYFSDYDVGISPPNKDINASVTIKINVGEK
jgi:hypothetical protein